MRLWHEGLIPNLPRQQLLGQHRECCALRGNGWGKKHRIVDYVFEHPMEKLVAYHNRIIDEMERRGYKASPEWYDKNYRGKKCQPIELSSKLFWEEYYKGSVLQRGLTPEYIYPEHNTCYYQECLDNLAEKGIIIK